MAYYNDVPVDGEGNVLPVKKDIVKVKGFTFPEDPNAYIFDITDNIDTCDSEGKTTINESSKEDKIPSSKNVYTLNKETTDAIAILKGDAKQEGSIRNTIEGYKLTPLEKLGPSIATDLNDSSKGPTVQTYVNNTANAARDKAIADSTEYAKDGFVWRTYLFQMKTNVSWTFSIDTKAGEQQPFLLSDSIVIVGPAPNTFTTYSEHGVYCKNQSKGTLTFSAIDQSGGFSVDINILVGNSLQVFNKSIKAPV